MVITIIMVIIIIVIIIIVIIITLCLDRVARNSHWLINLWPCSTSRSNWNVEVLVFVEGGNPENPEKNPRSKVRTNNKLNPHETASTGIEPVSNSWEASPYPLRKPLSPMQHRIKSSKNRQGKKELVTRGREVLLGDVSAHILTLCWL